jgi:hypothetical protein
MHAAKIRHRSQNSNPDCSDQACVAIQLVVARAVQTTSAKSFVPLISELEFDMSISSVAFGGSAHATAASRKSELQQRSTDFSSLAQALSSDDLSGAQAAYANLQSDPRPGFANHSGSPSPQRISDLKKLKSDTLALGAALNAGKLGAAKSAFAILKQDMSTAHSGRVAGLNGAPTMPSGASNSTLAGNSSDLRSPVAMSSVGGTLDLTA